MVASWGDLGGNLGVFDPNTNCWDCFSFWLAPAAAAEEVGVVTAEDRVVLMGGNENGIADGATDVAGTESAKDPSVVAVVL